LNYVDYILVLFFGLWIISSLCRQIFHHKFAVYDKFDLLPNCRFFAPRPLSHDYRIYAKGINTVENTETVWRPIVRDKRSWWNFLWNPRAKLIKTVFDLSVTFISNPKVTQLHLPYLIILNHCDDLFKNENIDQIKFMVVKYAGYDDSDFQLIFESKIHAIERAIPR
jgi:hypothetical protein